MQTSFSHITMDDTSHESDTAHSLIKTKKLSYTLKHKIARNLRGPKYAIQEAFYLRLASVTNALEARTAKLLLRDVGRASAPNECPEGNVRLHDLCKTCTRFSQHSVALRWLDDSNPHSNRPPRERYRLCTVTHLRRWNGRCHFCTSLYFFVSWFQRVIPRRLENWDKEWLYLYIDPDCKPWEHGSVRLDVWLYPRDVLIKTFDLRRLAGM